MKELSLHILDIAQNSIAAGAKRVSITIDEDVRADRLTIEVADDGCGMDREFLLRAADPFTTTRKTRRIGLGLPLLKQSAESAGGRFDIFSEKGKGTKVRAEFAYSHIDRMPLGDVEGTLMALIRLSPDVDFIYSHSFCGRHITFSTAEVREMLGKVPIGTPEVLKWIYEYLKEQSQILYGGALNEISG